MTCHSGNVAFKNILELRLVEHSNSDLEGKMKIEFDIMHWVLNVKRGRFLTWDNDGWWSDMLSDYGGAGEETEGMDWASNNLQEVAGIATGAIDVGATAAAAASDANNPLRDIQSKVHYAFRDLAKKRKKNENIQILSSSTSLFQRQQD